MFPFRFLVVFLFVANVNGNSNTLNDLIQRITKDVGAVTVCLFGSDKEQFNNILVNISNIPVVVFTTVPSYFIPEIKFGKQILLLPVVKDNKGNQTQEIEKVIERVIARKVVVVIYGTSVNQLQGYFAWLSRRKFTRMFGIVGSLTWTYFPYANHKLQRLSKEGRLPDVMRDLNGFNFRTNVQMDAPRSFVYTDRHGKRIVAGYAAEMFFGFIRKHKARYTEVQLRTLSNYDIPSVINATIAGQIDLSMNPYIHVASVQQSYPFKFLRWIILIPHNEYVDPNEYFTRPFTWSVWIAIVMMAVYITLLDLVMDYSLHLRVAPWHSLSRTLCTFLNLSSARRIEQGFRFHAQVMLMAFILSNLYFVHLTSFLTVFIKAKQAYTLQDLLDSQIRILMIDTEVSLMPLENLPIGFENIVTGVGVNELNTQRYSARNKSFAYAVPSDKATYILSQQVNLDQLNFHLSEDAISDTSFGFMLAKDSPFVDIISACVLEQQNMGLIEKWETDAIQQGREAGILHLVERQGKTSVAFTFRHLSFAWNCLGIGLAVASVVFFLEICTRTWFKFEIKEKK